MADVFGVLATSDMTELGAYVASWVAYGIGLSIVFWTLGYCVWFIIQFLR